MTIISQTKEITRSGQYWAFVHFSRLVRRGATRLDSQSTLNDIDHVVFENSDGRKVLVLTNGGPQRSIALQLGPSTADLTVASNSVTTLAWA